ncbi:MAG: DNA polymerase IV [Lachnospiraceae bacterium]|nr:DNA polymerase IV [Lachnospiraceae bacterium]
MSSIFFHIDVNSAFLSWTAVEELNNGGTIDLRTVPSIIGGDQDTRHGIVTARSIPAKKYGIKTAEPVASAFSKCPNLIMRAPNFSLYSRMSHDLVNYLHTLTDDVEQASVDECYLDFGPIAHMYESPVACADMIRHEIFTRFGFTVNVGISDKKVLAKMASDFLKPDKTHTLFSYEIREKMWPLPVGDLFLCGKSAQATLQKLGINTIGELANSDISIITSNLKSLGQTLWEFANGIDDSKIVTVPPEAKGIGNSTTVARDITDREEASKVLYSLSESVSRRLHRANFLAKQVTVEIKYYDFKSFSHQTCFETPIETADAIHAVALSLFDRLWDERPIRLLGIRASKLVTPDEPYQLSLFSEDFLGAKKQGAGPALEESSYVDSEKKKKLDEAMRTIRDKFGRESIHKGL